MANPRQPSELIAEVAEKMDEVISTSSDWVTSNKTINALNYAQAALYKQLVRWDSKRFLTYNDISLVANTQEYALPNDFLRAKRMEIITSDVGSMWNSQQLEYVDFHNGQQYYNHNVGSGLTVFNFRWTLRNDKIRFLPTPTSSAASALRLWYYKKPIDMHTGTAAAGTTSSITLDSTPTIGQNTRAEADYYNLADVITTGGTGSGQTAGITDYTAAYVASATFSTAPDATTTYEILSMLHDEELELLVLEACRRIAQLEGPAEVQAWAGAYGSERMQLFDDFKNFNARRQTNTPRKTRIVIL